MFGVLINAFSAVTCLVVAGLLGYLAVTGTWPLAFGAVLSGYVSFRFFERAREWWRAQ